jgi:hypothetical protein
MYHRHSPQRIGYTVGDYEGVYEFYKRLERRARTECLWKICMAISVPVMLWMSVWCATQYVDWSPLSRVTHLASSGSITE